jgi:signal transduction histidine kinase/CheY-like chemotaxis protein
MVFQLDSGIDGSQRHFTYVSAGAEKLHGLSADALMQDAQRFYGQLVEADRQLLAAREADAQAAMIPFSCEVRFHLPSQETRWSLLTSAPRRAPTGHVIWDGIEIDITERKQMGDRLRHSEKMDAMGQLAGGIAHDFNNILGGIVGAAELTMLGSKDPQVHRRQELILAGARRAGDLTRRLLAYARKSKNVVTELSVNALVDETLTLFTHAAGPLIRIERQLDAAPDHVGGDAAELQAAVLNLCVNARDAMPGGGTLLLCTSRQEFTAPMIDAVNETIAPGAYVRIDVSDTGAGIPDDIRLRIFEPYFTTKPEGHGTGLGLPAAVGTAHGHRGALLLESIEGRGTTVSILLPAVRPGALAEGPVLSLANARGNLIILVDDDAQIRRQAAELLTTMGFSVVALGDPREAIERLRDLQGVGCLLLDLAMPSLNGRDVYRYVRGLSMTLPVIISSGFAGGGEVAGGDDDPHLVFLPKPWLQEQLRQALYRLGVLKAV